MRDKKQKTATVKQAEAQARLAPGEAGPAGSEAAPGLSGGLSPNRPGCGSIPVCRGKGAQAGLS